MTCAEFRGGAAIRFEDHTHDCSACARYAENQNRIRDGLRALAVAETRGPSAALQSALLREWRPARDERPWRTAAWAGALAAGLACVLLLLSPKQESRPSEKQNVAPAVRAVDTIPTAVAPKQHKRRLRHMARARQASAEAEFVEVPFAAPLETSERAQLLRVSMPVATLASWGFPVAAGDPDRVIDADVLVGENGLARAVRLIR